MPAGHLSKRPSSFGLDRSLNARNTKRRYGGIPTEAGLDEGIGVPGNISSVKTGLTAASGSDDWQGQKPPLVVVS